MSRSLRLIWKLCCIGLVVASVGSPVSVDEAAAKCPPGRLNDYLTFRFVGSGRNGAVGGAYANIKNYSPWTHYISSNASTTSAWSMLALTDGSHYAQVGWLEFPVGVRWTFVEYTKSTPGQFFRKLFSPQPTDSYTYYTTLYNFQPGKFTFQVNGADVWTTSAVFVPNVAWLAAETHTFADQMAGGSSLGYRQDFFNSHVWLGGSWQAFAGAIPLNSDYNEFTLYGTSTYDFSTWDNRCSQ